MSYGYYGYGPDERVYGPGPRYRGQWLLWKETASPRLLGGLSEVAARALTGIQFPGGDYDGSEVTLPLTRRHLFLGVGLAL
jgi:hypothetical protein